VRTAALPEAERPKAITAALADVDAALGRLGEVESSSSKPTSGKCSSGARQTASWSVRGTWPRSSGRRHRGSGMRRKDDLALVQEVKASAEQAVSDARQALAGVVLKHSVRWQRALERRWLELDAEAGERLAALRATESDRASVVSTHGWLMSAVTGDALAQLQRPYRERGHWRSRLLNRSGEPYFEHELLDGLEELLDEMALQRRLDAEAAAAQAEEERLAKLRAEQQQRMADARAMQQARLARLQPAKEAERTE
jgi:hypothetical protein